MLAHRRTVAPHARFVIGQAERLPFAAGSFELVTAAGPPMTFGAYLRHALSEVNVDSAIARGACSAEEASHWCRATLKAVFADGEVTVVIPGYVATLALTWP